MSRIQDKVQSLSLLNNKKDITCAICLDVVTCLGKLPVCSHNYCYSCVLEWSKRTNKCPLCKKTFRCITKINCTSPNRKIRVPDISIETDSDNTGYAILPDFEDENEYNLNDSFIDDSNDSDSTSIPLTDENNDTSTTSSNESDNTMLSSDDDSTIDIPFDGNDS